MKASGSSCLVVALEETTVSNEDPDPAGGLGAKGTTVRDFVCRNNESAYMTLT